MKKFNFTTIKLGLFVCAMAGTTLMLFSCGDDKSSIQTQKQVTQEIQKQRYYSSSNGHYKYALLFSYSDASKKISSLQSVTMTSSGGLARDIMGTSFVGALTEDLIRTLKGDFGDQVSDAALRQNMSQYFAVIIGEPQIEAGSYSLKFKFVLSDNSTMDAADSLNLSSTVTFE